MKLFESYNECVDFVASWCDETQIADIIFYIGFDIGRKNNYENNYYIYFTGTNIWWDNMENEYYNIVYCGNYENMIEFLKNVLSKIVE